MNELFFSYIPGKSFLHRLDPRTKLISVMLLSIVVLRASSFQDIILLLCIFLVFALLTKLGIRHHLISLRPMLLFFTFIFTVQAMFSGGESILSIGPLGISSEGLWKGGLVTSRFILLVLFASLLISTTRPALLTLGIERMLRPLPLSLWGISSYDLAIMMSISMRFVPLLRGSLEQIAEAQISRGMDLHRYPLKGVSSMAVPMIHNTLRMTEDLAMAMESRCYQGIHRTSMFELKMHKEDWSSLFIVASIVTLFFYL
jgi:energy-coupling factor transport system permease protein